MAGGLYWPTQGFPLDYDVREHFGMDYTQVMVDVNLLFYPMFEVKVLRGDERAVRLHRHRRRQAHLPEGGGDDPDDGPVADHGWDELEEAQGRAAELEGHLAAVSRRTGASWSRNTATATIPLAIGGYPHGSSARWPTCWATRSSSTGTTTSRSWSTTS